MSWSVKTTREVRYCYSLRKRHGHSTNHISLKQGLDAMQGYPLHFVHFAKLLHAVTVTVAVHNREG